MSKPSDAVTKALSRVGERETSKNWSPLIRVWLRLAGIFKPAPWCAAFVTACLKSVGWKEFPPHPARVSSWHFWAAQRGIRRGPGYIPRRGDLFYWLNPDLTGHIGFVVEANGGAIRTVEGNTDDGGSREGDGVYQRDRIRDLRLHYIELSAL